MRKFEVGAMLCCCFFALAVYAQGQTRQKPGLWEVTTQMNFSGAGAPLPLRLRRTPRRFASPRPWSTNTEARTRIRSTETAR
jgi:hypothetical protein